MDDFKIKLNDSFRITILGDHFDSILGNSSSGDSQYDKAVEEITNVDLAKDLRTKVITRFRTAIAERLHSLPAAASIESCIDTMVQRAVEEWVEEHCDVEIEYEVSFTVRGEQEYSYTITAEDEEKAEDLAREKFSDEDDDHWARIDDYNIEDMSVEEA